MRGGFAQQLLHPRALIYKHTDVTLRLSQTQGLLKRCQSSRYTAMCLLDPRLQYPDFDGASHPPAGISRFQEPLEQRSCFLNRTAGVVALIAGQEDPDQRHMLELAQVVEVVCGGQLLVTNPV